MNWLTTIDKSTGTSKWRMKQMDLFTQSCFLSRQKLILYHFMITEINLHCIELYELRREQPYVPSSSNESCIDQGSIVIAHWPNYDTTITTVTRSFVTQLFVISNIPPRKCRTRVASLRIGWKFPRSGRERSWRVADREIDRSIDRVRTFPAHAHFQALFQSAKLALIPMVLVDGTVPISTTRVGQVSPDAPLEEALASWKEKIKFFYAFSVFFFFLFFSFLHALWRAIRKTENFSFFFNLHLIWFIRHRWDKILSDVRHTVYGTNIKGRGSI